MRAIHARGDNQIKSLLRQYEGLELPYNKGNFKPEYFSRIQCPTLIIHDDQKSFGSGKSLKFSSSFSGESCRQITSNVSHTPLYGELNPNKLLEVSMSFIGH